jgi:hypothetical protein
VANAEYARHIAADWNVKDEHSGFAGFVTAFDMADGYLSTLEPHAVGASKHVEYWVPEATALVQPPNPRCHRRAGGLLHSWRRPSEANGVPNGVEEVSRGRDVVLSPGWRRCRPRWQEPDNF